MDGGSGSAIPPNPNRSLRPDQEHLISSVQRQLHIRINLNREWSSTDSDGDAELITEEHMLEILKCTKEPFIISHKDCSSRYRLLFLEPFHSDSIGADRFIKQSGILFTSVLFPYDRDFKVYFDWSKPIWRRFDHFKRAMQISSTLSTVSGSASITHVPFLIHNVGANLALAHDTVSITNTLEKPMEISDIKGRQDIGPIMWGGTDLDGYFTSHTLPRNWPHYDSFIVPAKNANVEHAGGNLWAQKGNNVGTPMLNHVYEQGVASRAVDSSEMFEWSYKPKIGIIRNCKSAHGMMVKDDNYFTGSTDIPARVFKVNENVQLSPNTNTLKPASQTNSLFTYDQAIEKSFIMGRLNEQHPSPLVPSFTLGINPVPNNAPSDVNSYVNCKMIVQMMTKITIGCNYETYTAQDQTLSHADEFLYDANYTNLGNSLYFDGISFDSNSIFGSNVNANTVETVLKHSGAAGSGIGIRRNIIRGKSPMPDDHR